MTRLSTRRSRLIAAQAVLVLGLCALLYVGLLRPTAPSPLSGVKAPGAPAARNPAHRHHRGSPGLANRKPLPAGGQTASSGGGGGAGNPAVPGSPAAPGTPGGNTQGPGTPGGNTQGPGGDQYLSSVISLKSKLGLIRAKSP